MSMPRQNKAVVRKEDFDTTEDMKGKWKTLQNKTKIHYKTRQERQDKTRQGKARQDKTGQKMNTKQHAATLNRTTLNIQHKPTQINTTHSQSQPQTPTQQSTTQT